MGRLVDRHAVNIGLQIRAVVQVVAAHEDTDSPCPRRYAGSRSDPGRSPAADPGGRPASAEFPDRRRRLRSRSTPFRAVQALRRDRDLIQSHSAFGGCARDRRLRYGIGAHRRCAQQRERASEAEYAALTAPCSCGSMISRHTAHRPALRQHACKLLRALPWTPAHALAFPPDPASASGRAEQGHLISRAYKLESRIENRTGGIQGNRRLICSLQGSGAAKGDGSLLRFQQRCEAAQC